MNFLCRYQIWLAVGEKLNPNKENHLNDLDGRDNLWSSKTSLAQVDKRVQHPDIGGADQDHDDDDEADNDDDEDDNDVDADDHNMEMKKPESKVILSNVEASGVESINSGVVTLKSGYCYCYCYCLRITLLFILLLTAVH